TTGATGGTFSSSPAGLNIDATTGVIDLAASTAGTYTVTYSFGTAPCNGTATSQVTVNSSPTATVSGGTFCATGTTTLTTTGATGGTFSATPAGLTIDATTGVIDLAASTAGTYTVTYSFGTAPCNGTATSQVTVSSQIIPTFDPIGPVCSGSIITLPASSKEGITGTWSPAINNTSTTIYTFTPTGGQCAVPTTITITVSAISSSTTTITTCNNQLPYAWNGNNYTGAGTYTITLQNAAGCDSIATLILRVNNTTTSTTRDSICANQAPYIWNGNNYTASGTYSVTLTNSAGCDSIATLILLVKPIPALVINQPPPVCEPLTINLTAASITAGSDPGLVYTYWRDSLATIPLTNPNAIAVSGTYYIKAQGGNSCTSTKPVAVTVLIHKLIAGIRYPTVTTGPNVPLQLGARNIGLSYAWIPPVGLSSPFIKDPVFNYDRQTEYLINITRDNGCITVDTILVKIIPRDSVVRSDLFVPKAWTPNRDGHNDKLFPLTVNIRELKYFRIFNRWGQLVFETNVIGQGWDGIFQGKPAVMDVYTWTVEAIGVDGKYIKKAGNSVLIR
ncbi:MAG TPA: T9SS type B sorting domain-containing protein, partial [Chitinophagaceae bacterium]